MKTYECLDIVLKEYKDYFTARDLAKVANIPETTISAFRKGETNSGVKIFDRIRMALHTISPLAYSRFMQLLSELEEEETVISEIDSKIIKGLEKAPLEIQREILRTIASNRLFTRLAQSKNSDQVFTSV